MFLSSVNNLFLTEDHADDLRFGEELAEDIVAECKVYFEKKMLDQKYFIRSDTVFWRRPGKFIGIFKELNPVHRNGPQRVQLFGDDTDMEGDAYEGDNLGPQRVLGPVMAIRRVNYVVPVPARVFETSNLSSYTPSNWATWVTMINMKRTIIASVIDRYFIDSPQLNTIYLWKQGIANPALKPPTWQLQILLTSLVLSEIQPMMRAYGTMYVDADGSHRRTLDHYFVTIFLHFLNRMGLLTLKQVYTRRGGSKDWRKKLENHHINDTFAPFFLLEGFQERLTEQFARASIRINNEENLPEYISRVYNIPAALTQQVLDGPRQINGRRARPEWFGPQI